MLLTNSACWAKFERASLGSYKIGALSWMFREAKVAWDYLLVANMTLVLERHRITEGVLVLDESDRSRSKRTKRIHKAKKARPDQPERSLYPTKMQLALRLLQEFKDAHGDIKIKAALADAFTLRWLVAVFFEDGKLYDGWRREAKQLDEEGSSRGLILLFDHCPPPSPRAGGLQRKSQMDVLINFIKTLLKHQNPAEKLKEVAGLCWRCFSVNAFWQAYRWQRFRPPGTADCATVPNCGMTYPRTRLQKI